MQQRQAIFLRQRFTAGDGHIMRRMIGNLLENVGQTHILSAGKSVCGVAISAAQRAAGQTNEYSGEANAAGFALQGIENFSDAQLRFRTN
jgi:hypothetical protein